MCSQSKGEQRPKAAMGRDAWEEQNDWEVCKRGTEKSPWVGPQVQGAWAKDQVNEEEGGYLKKKTEDYI